MGLASPWLLHQRSVELYWKWTCEQGAELVDAAQRRGVATCLLGAFDYVRNRLILFAIDGALLEGNILAGRS